MLDFSGYDVPALMQDALRNYAKFGTPLDDFLEAVMCNDLLTAVKCANADEMAALKPLTKWILARAPEGSYGNEAIYRRWLYEKYKNPLEVV